MGWKNTDPKTIEECILPEYIKKTFKDFLDVGEMPNILLYGPSGIGKTTVAKALCKELNIDYSACGLRRTWLERIPSQSCELLSQTPRWLFQATACLVVDVGMVPKFQWFGFVLTHCLWGSFMSLMDMREYVLVTCSRRLVNLIFRSSSSLSNSWLR